MGDVGWRCVGGVGGGWRVRGVGWRCVGGSGWGMEGEGCRIGVCGMGGAPFW